VRQSRLTRAACALLSLGLVAISPLTRVPAAEPDSGQEIYKTSCAHCHGDNGEGVEDEYDHSLEGSLSVAQLATLIGETMPADDPGSLSADESQSVAAYIHDAFYSPVARERNRPARIDLARLTVRQYRQTIADLVGSFRPAVQWGDQRGLNAEYFKGRSMGGKSSAAKRIDSQVDFDFGTEAPVAEIAEPYEFSIRWQGSLLAPETGLYDFVVHTEHALRLWVNDTDTPLIDRWVKSGNDTEYRAGLYLVAGRIYPVRLEFTKAKQGVDDSDKQKDKPQSAPATIALLWRSPRGVLEPIPARQLSPDSAPEQFVCATPFPPDDRSYGWERGTSVSKAWDEAATNAAIDAAGYIADNINELAGTRPDASDRKDKLRAFCRTFCERAFRSPFTEQQQRVFVDRQFEAAEDPQIAVKRIVLLALKSPRFLFREVGDTADSYAVAARLSFGLWDSIPDQALDRAAAEGKLATTEQISQQAERMLGDYRAKSKLRGFLLTWLNADLEKDLSKDPKTYPEFDAATIADLRTSLELFLDEVLWSDGSDYRRLLLTDEVYVNDRLARFFGSKSASESEFAKTRVDDGKRAGILTHPYLMASLAHARESSPIHRGVFLVRGVMGQALRPPPVAVAPLAPDLHPGLTTRERVTMQTQPTNCMTCHSIINPLGFALEHYDAVGRYRETEHEKPVDSNGSYRTLDGKEVTFDGARELAEFVARSPEAHAAFVEQLFHHLVQQPVRAYGPDTLDGLRESFAANDFSIRHLAIEIMTRAAPVGRETGEQVAAR
jgi:cytochrome c5